MGAPPGVDLELAVNETLHLIFQFLAVVRLCADGGFF